VELMNLSCEGFLEELASKAAAPGGGGASALVGAAGVALGSMVGSLTVGKKKYAAVEADIIALNVRAEALRKRLAAKQKLPAYMVFNDSTLRQMALKKPLSVEELLNIPGVGEKKAARYGQEFLSVIEDMVSSR
jgi:formiminotetrahydrofolate cyclodeaminase